MRYPIRKRNGEIVELESGDEDALSADELLALAEEDSGARAVNEQISALTKIVGEIASRPPPSYTVNVPASPPPIVHVPPAAAHAASPTAWNCTVTKRDADGRIQDFSFRAVLPMPKG